MTDSTITTSCLSPKARLLLAHGAGAGMDHPFMEAIATGLAKHSIEVVRFNFPYMIKRQEDGKKRPPDRQPKLLAHYAKLVAAQGNELPLFIAGKSMGGRMSTLLLTDEEHQSTTAHIKGVMCLGYPFHAPGKKEQWRAEHFAEVHCPCLIIQGERDTFGNKEEIAAHAMPEQFLVEYVGDGDHSFKPRKKSGFTEAENIEKTVTRMAEFIHDQL